MTGPDTDDTDRAGRAFRTAVTEAPSAAAPTVSGIRRRVHARQIRRALAVTTVAVAGLVVGVAVLPTAWRSPGQIAAPASAGPARPGDPAPAGWRTEYYRGITFEVPEGWAYAYEPGCADEDQVRTHDVGAYVSFGRSPQEAFTTCDAVEPDRTEHVVVDPVDPGIAIKLAPERQVDGVWMLTRLVADVLVNVTGPDQARARRIADSVRPAPAGAPCAPRSPLDTDSRARPDPGLDPSAGEVDGIVVCQYEPDAGLRAAIPLPVGRAAAFLDQLRGPAGVPAEPCPSAAGAAVDAPAALSLVVRVTVDEDVHEAYVVAGDCGAGYRAGGLIDDGRAQRGLSRDACRAVVTGPVRLISPPHELEKTCGLEPVAPPTSVPEPPAPEPPVSAPPTRPATAKPPADGLRTEYYRDLAFRVPATWGYASAPNSAWCAGNSDGKPDADHRRPYVSLGGAQILPAIACPERPASLLTEHVAVRVVPDSEPALPAETRSAGWWIVTERIGGLELEATSRDRDRARQIVGSGTVEPAGAPCPPRHPLDRDEPVRPVPAHDLGSGGVTGPVTVCQYEAPVTDGEPGGLRAVRTVAAAAVDGLLEPMRSAPATSTTSCTTPNPSEIRVVVRFATGRGPREVFIAAAGCPDGAGPGYGGIDDGTVVRELTGAACRAILQPPVQLEIASGDLGRRCLG